MVDFNISSLNVAVCPVHLVESNIPRQTNAKCHQIVLRDRNHISVLSLIVKWSSGKIAKLLHKATWKPFRWMRFIQTNWNNNNSNTSEQKEREKKRQFVYERTMQKYLQIRCDFEREYCYCLSVEVLSFILSLFSIGIVVARPR